MGARVNSSAILTVEGLRGFSLFPVKDYIRRGTGILGALMADVKVDWKKCTGAEVCVGVCPMNVYDMVDAGGKKKAKPERAGDCIMCMACVSACPEQAITVE
jgi:NAD-dependent dihydropyrimidine dehydrogenase PreA subunit